MKGVTKTDDFDKAWKQKTCMTCPTKILFFRELCHTCHLKIITNALNFLGIKL